MSTLPLIIAGAGAAYVASQQSEQTTNKKTARAPSQFNDGVSTGKLLLQPVKASLAGGNKLRQKRLNPWMVGRGFGKAEDPNIAQLVSQVENKLKKEIESATCEQLKAFIRRVNEELDLNIRETCDVTYREINAAISAGVAAAGCSALPGGQYAAPVCFAATYWWQDKVGGVIQSVGESVWSGAKELYGDAKGWLGEKTGLW